MKRTGILINIPVNLGLSILEISKIVMCEFWYDYLKPTYCKETELYGYMDILKVIKNSNRVCRIKTKNIKLLSK